VTSGGGGSSSSKAGGLNDGARSMCMGRDTASLPVERCRCACWGRARRARARRMAAEFSPVRVAEAIGGPWEVKLLRVGTKDGGDTRCSKAPGQPQSATSEVSAAGSGLE